MAGVTNAPFRMLCREHGAGVFVSEMITARAVVERNHKTSRLVRFGLDESPRSLQLYGTDPATMAEAARQVIDECGVEHIDINLGCPVPKVTRRGGGAALTVRRRIVERILTAVVRAVDPVPVTVKFRLGIDDSHPTSTDMAKIAEGVGCAWVTLHARTAEQLYSGQANWSAIADLVDEVSIPVLGNGDIWTAGDAVAMSSRTGCAGVVIGRGCLGRPWLFADLAAAFAGTEVPPPPPLGAVAATMIRHLDLLIDWVGPVVGIREFRKHAGWYLKGYPVGHDVRTRVAVLDSRAELGELLASLDPDLGPVDPHHPPKRGRRDGPRKVQLPDGWYQTADSDSAVDDHEDSGSGG